MRIFANAHYPFLRWRRRAYVVSAVIILLGLGAAILNIFSPSVGSWVNYGVDFTGGTMVQVDFVDDVSAEEIRAVTPGWTSTRFGDIGASEYLVRVPVEGELGQDPGSTVRNALAQAFGEDAFRIVRTEAVGPTVGEELQGRAALAILISFVLTLIYLAFRFEWRFGLAAIVATGHDILITLGIIAALRLEVSVGTVAAILTIVGYSLNDTIVVFDRIREHLAKRRRDETFEQIIDAAINDTLPRTIMTTITALATLTPLYLFGGPAIRDFALVLILGIAIGTFSSIFVAAPALWNIEQKWPRQPKKATRSSERSRETAVV